MAVIINEFEVVVDPASTEASEPGTGTDTATEQAETQQISPQDLHNILCQQYQRMLRVQAD